MPRFPTRRLYCTARDENTDRTVNADTSGGFIFENVKAGHYTLHASHDGFRRHGDFRNLGRSPSGPAADGFAEHCGAVDHGGGDLRRHQINTENATLGDSKDNLQMTQLPLNNRATTTSPLGALGLSPNVQTDSSGNIALGGASSSMVNFSVDGISTANVQAEWRSAGCLSLAGRNRRRQGDLTSITARSSLRSAT